MHACMGKALHDLALCMLSTTHSHGGVVSYPDPNVRNDDYRLQYNITVMLYCNRYVYLGLGTRLMEVWDHDIMISNIKKFLG